MWCEEDGCWHDLILQQPSATDGAIAAVASGSDEGRGAGVSANGVGACQHAVQIRRTYASNWVPLWCGLCPPGSARARRAVEGLSTSGLLGEAGGRMG